MSYIHYNPNPLKLSVGDCTIRAISCALNISWDETYWALANLGFEMYDMPSAKAVPMAILWKGATMAAAWDEIAIWMKEIHICIIQDMKCPCMDEIAIIVDIHAPENKRWLVSCKDS